MGFELSDSYEGVDIRLGIDDPLLPDLSPGAYDKMKLALERATCLFTKIVYDQKSLENHGMSLEQSTDLLAEKILDLTYLFGNMAGDFDDGDLDFLNTGLGKQLAEKDLDSRHLYAARAFD